ncbi:hypothetical protein KF840_02395 [bacterium]|nr:hypothetical protein [bacterium]
MIEADIGSIGGHREPSRRLIERVGEAIGRRRGLVATTTSATPATTSRS